MRFPESLVYLASVHELDQELQTQGLDVVFDLSFTNFISPIGAVWCLLNTDVVLRQQRTLKILPPKRVDPVSWLERLNFFENTSPHWLHSCHQLHDMHKLQNRHRNDLRRNLVEVQRINDSDSVHALCKMVEQVLLIHGRPLTNRINGIVTELANNVVDHSHSEGYAAVQYYPKIKQIEIALGDSGIGVASSLGALYQDYTRLERVRTAFEDKVSTLVNEDRGYGLGRVRSKTTAGIQSYEFRVLTNGGVYRVFEDKILEEIGGLPVQYGTYYEIKIWE